MKKPSGGSTTVSGPYLTPKQKALRDRAEAANARGEAAKAREEAQKAGEEARRDEERAKADRKRHENKDARQEMREARADVARERRDLARAGRDQARAGRDIARARTAGLARAGRGGPWILGGNDRHVTCAAAALANSLLMATGKRVADEDVLALHVAVAGHPDAPASVLGVLETAQQAGLWGQERALWTEHLPDHLAFGLPARHGVQGAVADGTCSVEDGTPHLFGGLWLHGVIVELALPDGIHAVALGDGFAVTWGTEVPLTPAFLDRHLITAWAVTWAGPDPVIT